MCSVIVYVIWSTYPGRKVSVFQVGVCRARRESSCYKYTEVLGNLSSLIIASSLLLYEGEMWSTVVAWTYICKVIYCHGVNGHLWSDLLSWCDRTFVKVVAYTDILTLINLSEHCLWLDHWLEFILENEWYCYIFLLFTLYDINFMLMFCMPVFVIFSAFTLKQCPIIKLGYELLRRQKWVFSLNLVP